MKKYVKHVLVAVWATIFIYIFFLAFTAPKAHADQSMQPSGKVLMDISQTPAKVTVIMFSEGEDNNRIINDGCIEGTVRAVQAQRGAIAKQGIEPPPITEEELDTIYQQCLKDSHVEVPGLRT